MKTRDIVFSSMYLALYVVLDVISARIPILKMPNGGSIGLGVVVLCLASYHLKAKKGVIIALLAVVMQYLTQGLTSPFYFVSFGQLMLDYVIAFGVYGISCLLPNFKIKGVPVYSGIIVTNVIRFILTTLSGVWYWETPLYASAVYNFGYIFATMLVASVVVPILYERLRKIEKA